MEPPPSADVPPFGRFFLPGPTEVHPDVLRAQFRAVIGHRSPALRELMGELQTGLKDVFRTSAPVLVSTSSATGLMEAAVRNGVRARVLSLVNGAFSQRFADIAVACGFEVDTLEVEWGETVPPHALRERLARGGFDAVTVVHSETSTGALNSLREISEVVRERDDVVLLVDSVSGVGGAEVLTDEWKLDFVLTGSQKTLALPPGLAFAVASERLMERSTLALRKGVYFDLAAFGKHIDNLQTPNTPAVSLLYALAGAAPPRRGRGDGKPVGSSSYNGGALRAVGGSNAGGARCAPLDPGCRGRAITDGDLRGVARWDGRARCRLCDERAGLRHRRRVR